MGSADVAARVRLFFDAAWCLRDVHMPGSHARAPRAAAQRPRVAAEQTRGCAHQPRSAHFSNSRAFPSAVAAAHAAAMAPQAGDALLKAAEAADAQALVELHARHVRCCAFAHGRSGRCALTRGAAQASRSDSYSFDELAQTLSKKLKPRLCAALLAQARAPQQLSRAAAYISRAPPRRRPTTRSARCTPRPRRRRTARRPLPTRRRVFQPRALQSAAPPRMPSLAP